MGDFVLLAGTASRQLAGETAEALGVSLGKLAVERFPDGETAVWLDEPVRGKEVFILQSTSPPVNEHLVELLSTIDASRRAGASHITAIIPYYGYARADKRGPRQEPITARMVADLLETVGVQHVLLVDPHTFQMEGFFHVASDSLSAVGLLCDAMRTQLPEAAVVVSPDAGRVKMASEYGRRLNKAVAVIHKQRQSGTATEVTHLVGEVSNRPCLIIDDMIATGGTLNGAMQALLKNGARPEFYIAATHGVLVGQAEAVLLQAMVKAVWVTNTIETQGFDWSGLHRVSVAPLLADAIEQLLSAGHLSK